jgi:ABC-type bacteriocin/lantibiotic exporter with double-glycine peptidase domain
MKLAVPHFEQAYPHTCLPACVRMVLAYHNRQHSEEELVQAFNSIPVLGTRPENVIIGLEGMGYHALWFENAMLERLLELLAYNWPIIVFLRAKDLPHGRAGLHAVVVIDINGREVVCLDPALNHELHLELPLFLNIWANLGHQGLVIWV